MNRVPSKLSFFELLSINNIDVPIICDVGVHQYGTPELMRAFPRSFHILVEPVREFSQAIEELYFGIPHQLYQVGLGCKAGRLKLKLKSSGVDLVTHSQLLDSSAGASSVDDNGDCYEVDVKTLDWIVEENPLICHTTTLLKLDVDGNELKILQGAGNYLANFDLIMVEMPLRFYWNRLQFLIDHDFSLLDIVDPTYYHGHLSQVDMVFASPSFMEANARFRPWSFYEFNWDDYHHWSNE